MGVSNLPIPIILVVIAMITPAPVEEQAALAVTPQTGRPPAPA